MKLSIALSIIAFAGLFGYGSYREASDACEKWIKGGRKIEYKRPYTKSEILRRRDVQERIEFLKQQDDNRPVRPDAGKPSQPPPNCKDLFGALGVCDDTPLRDLEFIRKTKKQIIEDQVAADFIRESILNNSGVSTSTHNRKCTVDYLSSRKQILGLEFNKSIDKKKVYVESPFINPDWKIKKYFRY